MSSFHLCRQKDSMQCGIACLSMICHYYKKNYSIETLSKYCVATNQGVSLLGMSKAANKVGLQTVCAKLSVNQLSQVKLPCIIHWNQNHFVVLYKVKNGKKYSIADPGKGLLSYSLEEFCDHWANSTTDSDEKGIAMLLEPTDEFRSQNDDNTSKNRSFKFLYGYVKLYQKYYTQIIKHHKKFNYSSQPEALPPNRTTTSSWFKSSSFGVLVGFCSNASTLPAKLSTDSLVAKLSNKLVNACNSSLVA